MLNQDEGHAAVGRQRIEEPPEGIKATRRSS
jgi:hypothetical protein